MVRTSFKRMVLHFATLGIYPLRRRAFMPSPIEPPAFPPGGFGPKPKPDTWRPGAGATPKEEPAPPEPYFDPDVSKERMILSLDGGGMRGLLTLHVLKAIEQEFNKPIREIFSMVAGTSTGSIIAAGLAYGLTVDDLMAMFRKRAPEIFESNHWSLRVKGVVLVNLAVLSLFSVAALMILVSSALSAIPGIGLILGLIVGALAILFSVHFMALSIVIATTIGYLVGPLIFSPKYKGSRRGVFQSIFRDDTFSSDKLVMDLMVTAKDQVSGSEKTFFSIRFPSISTRNCSHPDLKIAAALTASSAAPTYFDPIGGCIDGGVGSYNCPSYLAAKVALNFSKPWANRMGHFGDDADWRSKYQRGKTVLWSVGTGHGNILVPENDLERGFFDNNLDGAKIVIEEGFQDSRDLQTEIVHTLFVPGIIRPKRFDIFLTPGGMAAIGLPSVGADVLESLDLDSVSQIPVFDAIGTAWANFLKVDGAFGTMHGIWDVGEPRMTEHQVAAYEQRLSDRLNAR